MTFKTMAFVMTFAGSLLGLRFMLAGASILKEWGIEATAGALVVCRRLGAIYLGLALTFLLGRDAAASELRSALCIGMGGAIAMLACLGLFELRGGRARPRILVSVVVEGLLAAVLAWVGWRGR
jgi:hypothetical protein